MGQRFTLIFLEQVGMGIKLNHDQRGVVFDHLPDNGKGYEVFSSEEDGKLVVSHDGGYVPPYRLQGAIHVAMREHKVTDIADIQGFQISI
jgi:hypothetical protein